MIFGHTNLVGSAACMILSNHVKDKIRCITDADRLLQPNTHNFYQCLRFPSREGAYLYFDLNKGIVESRPGLASPGPDRPGHSPARLGPARLGLLGIYVGK
jgi:hypothetical protein